jgi:glutamate receptor, ionotropic, plant
VAIGDITIRYNRTNYVDFSILYTDSGVAMIVPVKKSPKSTFTFLQPLSFGLWFGSTMFLIYAGITIWLMEPVEPDKKVSVSEHFGNILQLSLFAYRK